MYSSYLSQCKFYVNRGITIVVRGGFAFELVIHKREARISISSRLLLHEPTRTIIYIWVFFHLFLIINDLRKLSEFHKLSSCLWIEHLKRNYTVCTLYIYM